MTDEHLATEIRRAFGINHVSNPGLEERVIAAIDWNNKPQARAWPTRSKRAAILIAALAVVAVLAVTTSYGAAANSASQAKPISQEAAIADAMRQLPNNGAGYQVLKAELEPSSKHFQFVGPNGSGYGEDGVQECLVIPPLPRLPWLTPCRYYPVWVVALSSPTCETTVAINAYTGRFAGGGSAVHPTPSSTASLNECDMTPELPNLTWFQPTWG